jgi:hypothetical protein
VRLEYDRGLYARQCPDERALRGEVAAELGWDPFTETGTWRFHVAIVRKKNGMFAANGQLFDSDGATFSEMDEMAHASCQSLVAKLVAVWIAVVLTDPPLPPPAPPPPALPPSVVAPAPSDAPSPPAVRSMVRFGLGTVVGFDAAPRAAVGLAADVGVYVPVAWLPVNMVSFAMGVRWDPPASGYVLGGVRVSTSRLLATASIPCAHVWKLYGCGVVGLGRLWGGAEGIALPVNEGGGTYVVTGGRLGVEVPFAPHLGFRGYGEVLGTVTPQAIPIDERQGWTTPLVSGGLGVGLYLFD